MTTRKVIVLDSCEKGASTHCFYSDILLDTSPEHAQITLEGVNCTVQEFLDWFLIVERYHGRYDFCCTESGELIDIGGSLIDTNPGAVLEIDFNDYFNAWLDLKIEHAKREIL
ncbi:hypothetical protein [Vibrio chemaguriensis]|nr:hypothetical protein [Vibrio parahaemolyticus]HCH4213731.1 hypothetical protein [Vibrio parahaemolyticus]